MLSFCFTSHRRGKDQSVQSRSVESFLKFWFMQTDGMLSYSTSDHFHFDINLSGRWWKFSEESEILFGIRWNLPSQQAYWLFIGKILTKIIFLGFCWANNGSICYANWVSCHHLFQIRTMLLPRSICESIDPSIEGAYFPAKAVVGILFLNQCIFVTHSVINSSVP